MKHKAAAKNFVPEMHLPQIVADLKYRRKIAEVFSPELLGVRSISEFCGKKMI